MNHTTIRMVVYPAAINRKSFILDCMLPNALFVVWSVIIHISQRLLDQVEHDFKKERILFNKNKQKNLTNQAISIQQP